MYDSTFYFSHLIIAIKVLDNNGGTAYSGSEPTSESTSPLHWVDTFSSICTPLSSSDSKFLTTDFMPGQQTQRGGPQLMVQSVFDSNRSSGYTDGTYFNSVWCGTSQGTSSGAVINYSIRWCDTILRIDRWFRHNNHSAGLYTFR